jgi:hypothetical protein
VLSAPITVTDDGLIDHVVVFLDGEKVFWRDGKRGRMELRVDVPITSGLNALRVLAVDDQGIPSDQVFYVRGEAGVSADAEAP